MIVILKLIAITFALVMGVKISTAEGMIFEKIGEYGERKVKEGWKVFEALLVCPWCLPSIWSIVAHAFALGLGIIPFELNWKLLIRWPLVVMGASFVSGMAWTTYEMINRIKEKNEAETDFYLSALEEERDEQFFDEEENKYLEGLKN